MDFVAVVPVIIRGCFPGGKAAPRRAEPDSSGILPGPRIRLIPAAAPHIHGGANRCKRRRQQIFNRRDSLGCHGCSRKSTVLTVNFFPVFSLLIRPDTVNIRKPCLPVPEHGPGAFRPLHCVKRSRPSHRLLCLANLISVRTGHRFPGNSNPAAHRRRHHTEGFCPLELCFCLTYKRK